MMADMEGGGSSSSSVKGGVRGSFVGQREDFWRSIAGLGEAESLIAEIRANLQSASEWDQRNSDRCIDSDEFVLR